MHSVTNAIPTGTIASIPAKAHAHRALICAALANSPSTILLSRTSKDIDATMDSLRGLGAQQYRRWQASKSGTNQCAMCMGLCGDGRDSPRRDGVRYRMHINLLNLNRLQALRVLLP